MTNALALAAAMVLSQPQMTNPENWVSERPGLCEIGEAQGRLSLVVNATKDDGAFRVSLAEPVAVPEGCELFVDAMKSAHGAMPFRAVVEDAAGREWLFDFEGRTFLAHSSFFGGGFRPETFSCGEWRIRTRALAAPRKGVFAAADGRSGTPFPPFRFKGLELRATGELGRDHTVWLRNFRFTDASHANASFFYALWGQPQYGEADGRPKICPLDVVGRGRYATGPCVFEWELRDSFEGAPLWQGCVTNGPAASRLDVPQIEVPVDAPGTYWIRMKTTFPGRGGAAEPSATYEYRYDVFQGPETFRPAPVPEPDWLPVTRERVAEQERIRAEAVCRRNEWVRPPLPTGEEIRSGDHSLVEFANMGRDVASNIALMDEMATHGLRETVEIQTSWPQLEPLEGVYDFRAIDQMLDAAAARGLSCYVTLAPLSPPAWMPDIFTRNEEGNPFGHPHYTFNGGRLNVLNAPFPRGRFLAFAEALIRHVRNHPALLGYFYIVEHGGDAPDARWFEGYDPDTRALFCDWLAARYGTVAALNAAHGTRFASFGDAEPPRQLRPRPEDTPLRLDDWRAFKRIRVEALQYDFCELARRLDPTRSIMVYGCPALDDGVFDYARIGGVITANGGCDRFASGHTLAKFGQAGFPQRAEEISCGNWKANGERQLDRSLFAMLQGGGLMTHVKMFWPKGATMDDPKMKEGRGLDRFLKFVPILRELRGAERVADSVAAWGRSFGGWGWEHLLGAQLMPVTSVTPEWKKAKVVIVGPQEKTVRRARMEELADYAREGGTLVMHFDDCSTLLDDPAATNALLSALGIAGAPGRVPDWRCDAVVSDDSPWCGRGALRLLVREAAAAPDDAGEVLMRFLVRQDWQMKSGVEGLPALTRKRVGKGWVYVLWASATVPPPCVEDKAARDAYCREGSFLREIARDAGVSLAVRASRRDIYANLLRKGDTRYLLLASNKGMPEPARVEVDLPGDRTDWRAEELIDGETAALPLEVRLAPGEVRIYRLVH